MARAEIEQTIDGIEFKFRHLGARDAIRLESRLLRALGSNAGSLQRVIASGGGNVADSLSLLGSIGEEDLLGLVELIGKESSVRPEGGNAWLVLTPNVIDVQFAGAPKRMWMWFAEAIRFQLADFFGERPSA